MPTPFTPAADATWQTLLDELTLAYSERRQSIGQAAYTPADGRDVQAASYWTVIQQWIETNCISFIDHINGPINEAGNGFRYWTFEALLSNIGIAGDGFRRATAWDGSTEPAWSYGQMQAGDIIGPWIFSDLQAAFSHLFWLPLYKRIVPIRALFPQITGKATFSGAGPADMLMYNVYKTGLLGPAGTYLIALNGMQTYGNMNVSTIITGRGYDDDVPSDCGKLILQHALETEANAGFSSSLTFADEDVVVVGLKVCNVSHVVSHSESFTPSSVSASAVIGSEAEDQPGNAISYSIMAYIKTPFTNIEAPP
jgi:hypothetical protein